jgi:hypothetical protein
LNALSDLAQQSIHPRITRCYYDTGANETVVEDTAANWGTNELAGRQVTIGSSTYSIVSNTNDEIRLAGNQTALITEGTHYILLLSTPPATPATREDAVYLNVYIDEYDSTDDPEINKTIGGTEVEAMLRAKIIQTLFVREDNPTWGDLSDYTDSDGNQHYVFKLATITRLASNSNISTSMIADLVPTIGFEDIDQYKLVPLRARPTSPASNTVYVESGQALHSDGAELVIWPGGSTPFTFPAVSANPRWDALVLKDDGTLDRIQGSESATPAKPDFTYGTNPIAYVYIDETGTVVIDEADIDDGRALFTPVRQAPTTWKVLDPAVSLATQLGAAVAGDKFLMLPGTFSVSTDLDISTDDIVILGSKQSTIALTGTGRLKITGSNIWMKGFEVSVAAATTTMPEAVLIEGDGSCIEDVTVSPIFTRAFGIRVAASNVKVRGCTVNGAGTISQLALIRNLDVCNVYGDGTETAAGESPGATGSGARSQVAQSFTSPSGGGNLRAIWVKIRRDSSTATGLPKFRIETDSAGNPSGTLVQTGSETEAYISDSLGDEYAGWIRIPQTLVSSLSSSTTYWLVIDGSAYTAGYLAFDGSSTSVYANGVYKYWDGSLWQTATGVLDIAFMLEYDEADLDFALFEDNVIDTGAGGVVNTTTKGITISGSMTYGSTSTTIPTPDAYGNIIIRRNRVRAQAGRTELTGVNYAAKRTAIHIACGSHIRITECRIEAEDYQADGLRLGCDMLLKFSQDWIKQCADVMIDHNSFLDGYSCIIGRYEQTGVSYEGWYPCHGCRITSNKFESSGSAGDGHSFIKWYGRNRYRDTPLIITDNQFSTHSKTNFIYMIEGSHLIIENNVFFTFASSIAIYALQLTAYGACTVKGNEFSGRFDTCISSAGGYDYFGGNVIIGNKLVDFDDEGIFVDGYGHVIEGNFLSSTTSVSYGIRTQGTAHVIIGNRVYTTSGTSIQVNSSNGVVGANSGYSITVGGTGNAVDGASKTGF